MSIDVDAVRALVKKHAEAIGPGGEKAWLAGQLAGRLPALLDEVDRLTEQVRRVRQLCDQYKDQPPPIYRGPGLSEWGRGNNHGMRDMALAVLGTLDGWPEDDDGDQDADPNRCPICGLRPKADGYDACEQCAWSPNAVDEAELRAQADADRLAGLAAEVSVHQARVRDNWRPTAPKGGGSRG